MINRLRDMFGLNAESEPERRVPKYRYSRPEFLDHSDADLNMSADKEYRPIIVPRCVDRLPGISGYAECVNGGKSLLNEDQAQTKILLLRKDSKNKRRASTNGLAKNVEMLDIASAATNPVIPFTYFGLFDGHAGFGAAVYAKHMLHSILLDKLYEVNNYIFACKEKYKETMCSTTCYSPSLTELISGALEASFLALDDKLYREAQIYDIQGGCTSLVALFTESKLFVANAGDCRAIAVIKGQLRTLSCDFTPTSDRRRIQMLADMRPEWLGGEFCPLEFCRRIQRKDINTQILHRHAHCGGWISKICTEEDIKFPLIYGNGKKSRLMGTIGVSRGFGDHELRVFDTDLRVKPFLTPEPEVVVLELEEGEPHPDDVLVMASDGLWDVCTNAMAAKIVSECLASLSVTDRTRYVVAAQELVLFARGFLGPNGWRQKDSEGGGLGSGDDISVFVIPLNVHQHAVVCNLDDLDKDTVEASCPVEDDKETGD